MLVIFCDPEDENQVECIEMYTKEFPNTYAILVAICEEEQEAEALWGELDTYQGLKLFFMTKLARDEDDGFDKTEMEKLRDNIKYLAKYICDVKDEFEDCLPDEDEETKEN